MNSGMGALNVLAIVRSAPVGQTITTAIPHANGTAVSVRVGNLKSLGALTLQGTRPDVLVVDLDVNDPDDLAALGTIVNAPANEGLWVIATAPTATLETMRQLLREGVDDFLPQPIVEADLTEALRTAKARAQRKLKSTGAGRMGKVLTFTRAGGGLGSTTLAVHTAISLRQIDKNKDTRVCLLDLDLQFGNIDVSLDLASSDALINIVRAPERLDSALLQGSLIRHRSGIDVLPCPNTPIPLDALTPDVLSKILELARHDFDYVVIDMPPGLTSWTETVLSSSDFIGLVVQLSVPALKRARRLLDMIQESGHYALPISVICNRYVRRWGDGVNLRNAEQALGRPIDHLITNDYRVVSGAQDEGVTVFDVKRRRRFVKNVQALAKAAVQQFAAAKTVGTNPA
jgi:pilus assembly protein CpaE